MTRTIPGRMAAAILASTLACGPAAAAVFACDLTVAESIDAIIDAGAGPENVHDLPDIGTTGSLPIDLAVDGSNAGDAIPPQGADNSSFLTLSAEFSDPTTGLDPSTARIRPQPGRAQFRNGKFPGVAVALPGAPATGTVAGSFPVLSVASGGGLPATPGDPPGA